MVQIRMEDILDNIFLKTVSFVKLYMDKIIHYQIVTYPSGFANRVSLVGSSISYPFLGKLPFDR